MPLLPILGARMAGFDPGWLAIVQLFPTVLLVISVFLLIDIALSETVTGAYDNASGVAAVLSAAEELDREPPQSLDVWVLLTGSEESLCEGMRSWVRAHRKELDPASTLIVNVDSVSHGAPGYEISEGAVISLHLDRRLVELSEALASADRDGESRYAATPITYSLVDDALPAQIRGLSAITITAAPSAPPGTTPTRTLPSRVDPDALTRATEFVVGLARLLDRDIPRPPGRRRPGRRPEPRRPDISPARWRAERRT